MTPPIKNKAFLIGNGINRAVSNGVKSWEDLLVSLSEAFSVDVDLKNEFKPFPLTFEEILFKSKGEFDATLAQIKETIAKVFDETPPNDLHARLVHSGIENILTTNYDYAFEKSLVADFVNDERFTAKSTRETLHSIERRTRFKKPILDDKGIQYDLSIWHIHGEINQRLYPYEIKKGLSRANSIMIGYEHYGSYLAEIQKYLRGDKGKNSKSIIEKVADDNYTPQSWIDFFFVGELHIAGLSYDFSEQHLWWLLNYRAKQIKRGKIKRANKIFYYYAVMPEVDPEDPTKYVQQLAKRKINKAKMDMFDSLGVTTIPVEIAMNDYEGYYNQIFERTI